MDITPIRWFNLLIAYYSWTKCTEMVALELAAKKSSLAPKDYVASVKTEQIVPLNTPDHGMAVKALKALLGLREGIRPCQTDMSEYRNDPSRNTYGHLVIATPVWAHGIPPYTRQYLTELTNCSDVRFSVLAEMRGSGAERAIRMVRGILEKKGMVFVTSAVTLEKDVKEKKIGETLEAFARQIQADFG
jgi:flavodoxin